MDKKSTPLFDPTAHARLTKACREEGKVGRGFLSPLTHVPGADGTVFTIGGDFPDYAGLLVSATISEPTSLPYAFFKPRNGTFGATPINLGHRLYSMVVGEPALRPIPWILKHHFWDKSQLKRKDNESVLQLMQIGDVNTSSKIPAVKGDEVFVFDSVGGCHFDELTIGDHPAKFDVQLNEDGTYRSIDIVPKEE